jgi:hypothetical protein
MSWMRPYKLPAMDAMREVHEGQPLRLWGPGVKPKQVARTGRKAVASRMGVRFAKTIPLIAPRKGEAQS